MSPQIKHPITVVAADDHPLYLFAMRETIEANDELELVGVAGDGEGALEMIERHRPQVALLDMRMPKLDGREVVQRVGARKLDTRVLFVSEYSAGDLVIRALGAGAAGYLSKTATGEEICESIVRVAHGESVLSPGMGVGLAEALRERGDALPELTPRELDVLKLIAAGASSRGIAARLNLAIPTVKNHTRNLYTKLGVSDRGSAVAEAMRRGLVT